MSRVSINHHSTSKPYTLSLHDALPISADRIVGLLDHLGLPVQRPNGATTDKLIEVMRGDKKVRDAKIRVALPKAIGAMQRKGGWTVAGEETAIQDLFSLTA